MMLKCRAYTVFRFIVFATLLSVSACAYDQKTKLANDAVHDNSAIRERALRELKAKPNSEALLVLAERARNKDEDQQTRLRSGHALLQVKQAYEKDKQEAAQSKDSLANNPTLTTPSGK